MFVFFVFVFLCVCVYYRHHEAINKGGEEDKSERNPDQSVEHAERLERGRDFLLWILNIDAVDVVRILGDMLQSRKSSL